MSMQRMADFGPQIAPSDKPLLYKFAIAQDTFLTTMEITWLDLMRMKAP
jgi:hypothetical protein